MCVCVCVCLSVCVCVVLQDMDKMSAETEPIEIPAFNRDTFLSLVLVCMCVGEPTDPLRFNRDLSPTVFYCSTLPL